MQHLKPYIGRDVSVILGDDLTIAGRLADVHKDGVTLTKASAHTTGDADGVPIDGRAVIGYFSIQWVQVLD